MTTTTEDEEGNVEENVEIDTTNLYTILGLKDLSFRSSQKDIKRAYRKAILIHHPDKKVGGGKQEEDPVFLKIQEAYETLSDEKRRRVYDSDLDFDDYIPSGYEKFQNDKEFYELYGPIFESNARFSEMKPVPSLGDENVSDEDVESFYHFWMRFKSWREIKGKDEHDVSEATSRDERRWMQQENERKRKKMKKTENERLRNLVERAQRNDPRVLRIREKKRLEIEEKKRAKEEARRLEEERKLLEKKKKEEEEEERKRAEKERVAREKKERKRQRKFRRQTKERLIEMSASRDEGKLNEDDAAYLCERISIAELERILALDDEMKMLKLAMEILNSEKEKELEEKRKVEAEARAMKEKRDAEAEAKLKRNRVEWSQEEIKLLVKGLKKYPGGTRQRWKKIADMINTKCVVERTPKNCIMKSKNLDAMKSKAQKVDSKTAYQQSVARVQKSSWTKQQQKALQDAIKKYPSSLPKKERWVSIASEVPGKTLKECIQRVKDIRAKLKK
jgi:DnaJ family protein C protein 2